MCTGKRQSISFWQGFLRVFCFLCRVDLPVVRWWVDFGLRSPSVERTVVKTFDRKITFIFRVLYMERMQRSRTIFVNYPHLLVSCHSFSVDVPINSERSIEPKNETLTQCYHGFDDDSGVDVKWLVGCRVGQCGLAWSDCDWCWLVVWV